MLSTLILATLAVVSAKNINLENYTFEQYLSDFSIKYHPSEVPARRELFRKELAAVIEHNKSNKSWKKTMNEFSLMTKEEKRSTHGYHKGVAKSSQKMVSSRVELAEDFKVEPVEFLPKNVDWRNQGVVSPVKDQGSCGSCWAFAATAVIESHAALSTGKLFDLSVQQVAMCTPNPNHCGGTGNCHGSTSELAFDYVATQAPALLQEFQYSYGAYYGTVENCTLPETTNYKVDIDGYVKLPVNNYEYLMNAVAKLGPIAVSVDASTWHSYNGGIHNSCNQINPDINHAVVLVGYGVEESTGEKYWLVRNSWSPSWGENGYIRLHRTDAEAARCGLDVTPQDGSACEGEDDPQVVCGACGILFDSSLPVGAKLYSA